MNTNISLFNEMCNTESVVEVETVGLQLAQWILDSKLVEHIFGPNLHVEVSTNVRFNAIFIVYSLLLRLSNSLTSY